MKTDKKIQELKAIKNRIFLIKDSPNQYQGDIYLNKKDCLYAPPYSGKIIAVGNNIKDDDLKIGVRVTFHDLAGVEFKYNGNTVLSIRKNDITSVIGNDVIVK